MISAFRRAETFRGDAAVTTWLHRIVVNACLDRLRRRQVRAAEPLPDDLEEHAARGDVLATPAGGRPGRGGGRRGAPAAGPRRARAAAAGPEGGPGAGRHGGLPGGRGGGDPRHRARHGEEPLRARPGPAGGPAGRPARGARLEPPRPPDASHRGPPAHAEHDSAHDRDETSKEVSSMSDQDPSPGPGAGARLRALLAGLGSGATGRPAAPRGRRAARRHPGRPRRRARGREALRGAPGHRHRRPPAPAVDAARRRSGRRRDRARPRRARRGQLRASGGSQTGELAPTQPAARRGRPRRRSAPGSAPRRSAGALPAAPPRSRADVRALLRAHPGACAPCRVQGEHRQRRRPGARADRPRRRAPVPRSPTARASAGHARRPPGRARRAPRAAAAPPRRGLDLLRRTPIGQHHRRSLRLGP